MMPSSSSAGSFGSPATTCGSIGRVRSPSKMPTLSDIAARLNRDRESSTLNGSSPMKQPRLELTGRITSSPKPAQLGERSNAINFESPSKTNVADDERRMLSHTSPSRVPSSGASSPIKRMLAKGLPSLEEIQDRMSRKGLTSGSRPSSPTKPLSFEDQVKSTEGVKPSTPTLAPQPSSVEQETPVMQAAKPALTISTKSPSSGATVKLNHPLPPSPAARPATHPLQHEWTLFFDTRSAAAPSTPTLAPPASPLVQPSTPTQSASSWEANLRCIGAYTTVEAFLSCFAKLRRPSQLERHSSYHCFKDGIKPMWEDARNANGGKWTLTFRQRHPALVDRSWLWLVLGLIGEEMDEGDEVCGAVCSVKPRGDRISLWVRDRSDVDKVNRIGKKLASLLEVENEPGVTLEFSAHSDRSEQKLEGLYSLQNPTQMVRTPTMGSVGDKPMLSPGVGTRSGTSPTSPQTRTFGRQSISPNPSSAAEPFARLNGQQQSSSCGGMFSSRSPAPPSPSTMAPPTSVAGGTLARRRRRFQLEKLDSEQEQQPSTYACKGRCEVEEHFAFQSHCN
ncbi:eukaryotic translation initiation factor [Pseudozyma hubeiensis SY62]|uniref:Eukaryotic translation initiation factor n=1 Tax=Pseudozyma hubeiensis (strain SY62) TaxID=1305764 RepID=R9P8S5_PSEHS|nr:eukaryotic translation initiation factor [Pseudozyma hubeiensis SY62]GAC97662.1 eukaryotic translation initiation factor [Pseudozyma hubeiensis SY62]